ncbi:TonB-dependent receptor [Sphingopyxis sp.]|jgi:iron complex outermembrane receptor protein|uniref:TonB-dependent receptor n=1 Tax=Sphingopyxis sp. TaxID=1908224 RepID=UPI002DE4A6B3|nr:TonB-dependent receptor [Sphingopyxis sp.]
MTLRKALLLLTTCAAAIVPAAPALAQEADTVDGVSNVQAGEIIVTAQRREEKLQDVPVSVTVVGAAQLERQNVSGISELTRSVPALSSSGNFAGSSNGSVGIRGISTAGFAQSSEASVSVVLDGVVLGRAQISNLFDLERVEVLAGPQGMLFGKNASAGVVNVVTKAPDPSKFEAIFHSSFGNYKYLRQRATLNVPVSSTAALRVSGHYDQNGGFVRNTLLDFTNKNYSFGGRARFLWEPTERLTINIIGDYDRIGGNSGSLGSFATPGTFAVVKTDALRNAIAACGIVASPTNRENCSEGVSKDFAKDRARGLSAQIDYDLGGDYVLTSITARRWRTVGPEFGKGGDTDLLPADILSTNAGKYDYDTFSQELRLTSPDDQFVSFVAGLYYQDARQNVTSIQGGTLGGLGTLFGLPATARIGRVWTTDVDQKSYAAFGQAEFHVSDTVSLIAGGRFTHETLRDEVVALKNRDPLNPSLPSVQDFGFDLYTPAFAISDAFARVKVDNFSWKLGAQYKPNNDLMAYFTASKGYKGPAVNDTASPPLTRLVIEPEKPLYFELGLKAGLLDGRMLMTLALFSNKIENFQTAVFTPATATNPTPGFAQGNASHVLSQGFELGLSGRPLPGLTLNGGIVYNRAKYAKDFLVACNPEQVRGVGTCSADGTTAPVGQLANTPEWRVLLNGEYTHGLSSSLDGFIQSDLAFQSGFDFSPTPNPVTRTGAQWMLGGRIGVRTSDGRYGVSLFGRNLLDKAYPFIQPDSVSRFNGGGGSSYIARPSFDWNRSWGISLDARF